MCDYSLHAVASRPANAGDSLVTTSFPGTITRGFSAVEQPAVAVCLLPGTELVFDKEPERDGFLSQLLLHFGIGRVGSVLARFRRLNQRFETAHHDALEFSNGTILFLTSLQPGQRATVLQLPAAGEASKSFIHWLDRPPAAGRVET